MKIKFLKKKKIIQRVGDVPYLIRWNLFECPLFSIKLHRILLSDFDCLHDHPWSFLSIILRGGYVEHREIECKVLVSSADEYEANNGEPYIIEKRRVTKIFHPGSIIFRRATDKHKLEIHQPATTLVITFKKKRQWGFWTRKGWVPFYDYHSTDSCE